MSRRIGDQHFIVVENQCSSRCPYKDLSLGYPTVTDPQGKILISLHNYMSYKYSTWTIAAAISHAEQDYQAVLKGEQTTGWYALATEGGPDPQVSTCNGPHGTTSGCPPDDILPGSAGYTNVSLVFIQTLTQLFDSHNPRINWVWWPAGHLDRYSLCRYLLRPQLSMHTLHFNQARELDRGQNCPGLERTGELLALSRHGRGLTSLFPAEGQGY